MTNSAVLGLNFDTLDASTVAHFGAESLGRQLA
jgi:hypothetical protein